MAKVKLNLLSRTYAYVQRYQQIMFVLLKYGFDDLIASLNLEENLKMGWKILIPKRIKKDVSLSRAARIRIVMEELGPTFIKLGQALSTRSDLLPQDVLEELALLQDRVPAFSTEAVKRILDDELKQDWKEVFPFFEEEPIAAASIGQVHKAHLQDGTVVAVKVQRPGIRKKIDVDLEILQNMATLMERHMELAQVHRPTAIVEEFARTIHNELDYDKEASNAERFARMFSKSQFVQAFGIYRNLSTSRVLTMEFMRGTKPTQLANLLIQGIDPTTIAHKGCEVMMDQIFNHGFYHADPHPGNILVLEDERICFLDLGMVGRLDRQSREIFADLVLQVVHCNEVKAADSLLKLTHGHALIDRLALEREIAELVDQYIYRPLKELEVGRMIRSLMNLTVRHELSIPAHYFLLIKAISQIEDLGRALDPAFNFTEKAEPYIRKLLLNRYHPRRISRDLYETGADLFYLFKEVPGEMRELLKQAKQGKVKIELEHFGLRPLRATLNKVSSRIASAIVLASLIVGSSLIVLAGIPPKWHEIPVIGLAGYVISGVMGLQLLRSISRDENR